MWKWFCITSSILGSAFLSRLSICGEVWTRVSGWIRAALIEKRMVPIYRAHLHHPRVRAPFQPCGFAHWPPLCTRPLFFCTKQHLLFLIGLFSGVSTSSLQFCQVPRGASPPFPFTHSTFLFLNMFWPIFLFCFSNLTPWPCWMHQPQWPLITDRSSCCVPTTQDMALSESKSLP